MRVWAHEAKLKKSFLRILFKQELPSAKASQREAVPGYRKLRAQRHNNNTGYENITFHATNYTRMTIFYLLGNQNGHASHATSCPIRTARSRRWVCGSPTGSCLFHYFTCSSAIHAMSGDSVTHVWGFLVLTYVFTIHLCVKKASISYPSILLGYSKHFTP